MKPYIVTPEAGPYIAGQRNPGEGEPIQLSDRQAAHELRIGAVRAEASTAQRGRGRK